MGTNWTTVTPRSSITRAIAPGSFAAWTGRSTRRAPTASVVHSSHTDASKEMEVRCSTVSSGPIPKAAACHAVWFARLRCSIIAPLGVPVEPEV